MLVRYRFPGRRALDALVDLPFALPTAVSGIALTAIYATTGPVGRIMRFPIAFTPLGVTIALVFIGLPFVVRAVAPVLAEMGTSAEEASAVLGATRWQTVTRVTLPTLFPAVLTGTALAFARALGEYGSVVFIAGNMPMRTEIAPLLIMTRLDEYDYAGATAVAASSVGRVAGRSPRTKPAPGACGSACRHASGRMIASRDASGAGEATGAPRHGRH